ncbi:MAG: hypothetical protein H0V17_33645 [Deltaproteobacteria bacterium]|nr:hypothetical protein [Deltaproteobacteria bacterium]
MLERQDIDALLIGALYGELTPAEEARLQTHLESHPADKSALVGLTFARDAVRESRFLTVQLEPPQAVSALLLQEATRLAPVKVATAEETPRESWFARFVATFARHPAWAAAAMMVVVVGVAGTMYMRGDRSRFAEQTTSTADRSGEAAPAAAAQTENEGANAVLEAKQLELQAGSSFGATLAEPSPTTGSTGKDSADDRKEAAEKERAKPAVAVKPPANRTYFGVESSPPKPMDLDGYAEDSNANRKGGAAVGGARPSPTAPAPRNDPAVATPAPAPPSRAPGQATVPRGAGVTGGEDQLRDKNESDETVWAREQHTKVANAVRTNNCKDATALAVQLSNRAPAYYTQHVENDRSLKQCMTYINAEREKEADRQQRARALQKRNTDEATDRRDSTKRPAAPATESTK